MSTARLRVQLQGRLVGVIERHGGGSRFVPEASWAAIPAGERPVLGQRFEERPWTEVRSGQGLPDWFEHLLPEEGGPLRRAVARALEVKESRSFDIAETVGQDLPGAVVLTADATAEPSPTGARHVVEEPAAAGPRLATLRFSLAGVQLKFSGRSTERGIALGYGGDQIVKLADQRYDEVPANEHAVMRWASLSGLDVPPIRLIEAGEIVDLPPGLALRDPMAFVIGRYDRHANGPRIHQEDFAQVLGLTPREGRRDKYSGANLETIVRLVRALAPDDLDEMLRRVAFMVVSGNNDMHAKNWSLVYPDGVRPRLAPAYDLLCTEIYLASGEMALPLVGVTRFDRVTLDTFDRLSLRAGLDPAHTRDVVRDLVVRAVDRWPEVRPFAPRPVADFLDGWLVESPLIRQLGRC